MGLIKYENLRPIDESDRKSIDQLVNWGLCFVNEEEARLTYKGLEELKKEKFVKEHSLNFISDLCSFMSDESSQI